jgi:hypothetical protein
VLTLPGFFILFNVLFDDFFALGRCEDILGKLELVSAI